MDSLARHQSVGPVSLLPKTCGIRPRADPELESIGPRFEKCPAIDGRVTVVVSTTAVEVPGELEEVEG